MRRLFVDTFYLVALLYRRDAWHERVMAFSQTLTSDHTLLTTDAVLVELLATLSTKGPQMRREATETVRMLLESPEGAHLSVGGCLLRHPLQDCLRVGFGWIKEGLKCPVDPRQTQMQQMIEARFAPAHPD